ncbi:MAG: hypothetical protein SGBAC_011579 [Bacillariaceae sp.]
MSGTSPSSCIDEDDEQNQQLLQHNDNRPRLRQPQHHSQQEKATKELLRLLSTEIAKDGGASVVTSLKDYFSTSMNGKRFNLLLNHAIGKSKLLRFFEIHSEVFHADRTVTPHLVKLLSKQYVNEEDLISNSKCANEKLQVVRNKASYVLQKRQAKLNRRRKKQQQQLQGTMLNTENDAANNYTNDTTTANLSWLLEQSVGDLHLYLRASGFYVVEFYEKEMIEKQKQSRETQVPLVGNRAWQDLVLQEFGAILTNDPESRFELSDGDSPKVWLSHLDPNATGTNTTQNSTSSSSSESHGKGNLKDETETLDEKYLDTLEECLVRLVHQDGGHEVRLELLLHRHLELKVALGGRDFSTIYEQCCSRFQTSGISCRKEGVDWIFASTQTADAKYGGGGRMMVDEVGLYSVTNSKWGTAIGNIMVQCCKTTLGDKTELNDANNEGDYVTDTVTNSSKLVLVDMTASVGGMTLGLAKTEYFDQILAYEVDPERAKLCQGNMKRHGMENLVEEHRYCFVIDPPWGGVAYKQKTKRYSQFFMGPWSLKDVLVRMYTHCKPCLVGMRLPEDKAKVNDLLEELRQENLLFETKTIRRLSVQRFVVLYFLPELVN